MEKYTEQTKLAAAEAYCAGQGGWVATAKDFAVSVSSLRKWVAGYQANGVAGVRTKRRELYSLEFKIEVRRPLYVALKEVASTADKATKSYSDSASSIHFRWVAVTGGMAACCIAAVLVVSWVSLTWQRNQVSNLKGEKAALLVEVASLQATADKLAAKGGRATLTMCNLQGEKGRLCARVDDIRWAFGSKDKGLYYVLHGY